MAGLREVRIVIGKRSYRMQTALDEGTLTRVTSIVSDASAALGEGVDQDYLLMLTCLQLAYSLEKIEHRLTPLMDALSHVDPLPVEPDDENFFSPSR